MLKDYEIRKCDLIKGYRWLIFKRVSKNLKMHVAGGLTKKECEEWIKNNDNEYRKNKINKQRNIKTSGTTK